MSYLSTHLQLDIYDIGSNVISGKRVLYMCKILLGMEDFFPFVVVFSNDNAPSY